MDKQADEMALLAEEVYPKLKEAEQQALSTDKRFSHDEVFKPLNAKTQQALLEAERIARDPSVKGYTDVDELFAELNK